jgi:hypothetical protein
LHQLTNFLLQSHSGQQDINLIVHDFHFLF